MRLLDLDLTRISHDVSDLVSVQIDVTQEDIDKGCARDPWMCPVARAVKRVTRDNFYFGLIVNGIHVRSCGYVYKLPIEVQDWIRSFDGLFRLTTANMTPISFELQLPRWAVKP